MFGSVRSNGELELEIKFAVVIEDRVEDELMLCPDGTAHAKKGSKSFVDLMSHEWVPFFVAYIPPKHDIFHGS